MFLSCLLHFLVPGTGTVLEPEPYWNRNRILNTVLVPVFPDKYGSDRFRFRLRNPG